jgi:hypothetical protein
MNYMAHIKGILNKPEKTRLKGPECIMSQLKDLPEETIIKLQTNHQDKLSISHCSSKEKSVSNTIKQATADPLRKYSE